MIHRCTLAHIPAGTHTHTHIYREIYLVFIAEEKSSEITVQENIDIGLICQQLYGWTGHWTLKNCAECYPA